MKYRAMFAALLVAPFLVTAAYAADSAPVADGLLGGLVSLWGPFLGLLAAFVIFFDRVAKVIPNSTTSGLLTVLRKVAAVLGVKVPDAQ